MHAHDSMPRQLRALALERLVYARRFALCPAGGPASAVADFSTCSALVRVVNRMMIRRALILKVR